MKSLLKKYYEGINSVAVIGNYLPRQCGIATFTTDLISALTSEAPEINSWSVVMNDQPDGYIYPEKVRFEINQNILSEYSVAAQFMNISQADIVSVQHEFGIFGGAAGSHLIKLLGELRMPIVTTLHTVLKDPKPDYREVMLRLVDLSDKLIVMSHKAFEILQEVYGVPTDKIVFIHHGIPDLPFVDPNFYKEKFAVEGKKVLLTFGLLSPTKGIETVLQALPKVVQKHPDVAYIILGATHPHILKAQGEEYRIGLQQLVRKLGLSDHVIFQNRFVEQETLYEFLGVADIYITPYLDEAQITSGTLAYAMGTGKAVISTPYWYASEMLDEGRGRIVPFNNPDAMAEQIIDLLDNETERHGLRKKAYTFCREAIWKEVARQYFQVFCDVRAQRAQNPRPYHLYKHDVIAITKFDIPPIKLDHLKTMTDDTGIFQHAIYTIPNLDHGYCTDDNARALVVAVMRKKYLVNNIAWFESLSSRYLSFLHHAFNTETGRFRNFMNYSRQWLEEIGSEDSHGRAVLGLGRSIAVLDNPGQLAMATKLFTQSIGCLEKLVAPRATAFAIVGIHAYLTQFSGDSEVRRVRDVLADKLLQPFTDQATEDWAWLENIVTYSNGSIPQALLLSGQSMQREDMIEMGLRSLKWLLKIQTTDGHFTPVGNNGWYPKGGTMARFDQQPIEANTMIDACVEAYNVTRDLDWIESAVTCFNWFLGHNDLNRPLYDPKTGGCRDGLLANGINQNEGAESSLAWLLSLITIQKLNADVILKQPTTKPLT
ncbi:MAG TPA: glycosyltransferase [Thiotrichaceae bacterium]|nr:glycosyltransferase [Thiotrichaceae bacterium]